MLQMICSSLYAAQARGCYAASACTKITKCGQHLKQLLPSNHWEEVHRALPAAPLSARCSFPATSSLGSNFSCTKANH